MAKWEKRMQTILDDEKKKHAAVYKLSQRLQQALHGLDTIGIQYVEPIVKSEIEKAELIDSTIHSFLIEPQDGRDPDEVRLTIRVEIEGDFQGHISIETSSGYRNTNTGRIPIYYLSSYNIEIVSAKKEQLKKAYKAYKKYASTNMVDIALKDNVYLEYQDLYENYTIWHKQPSEYESSITGYLSLFNEEERFQQYKDMHDNTKKLLECEDVAEFARDKLHGKDESITYEWTEYLI